MKTALLALFFLHFAFSTQRLTTAQEVVFDVNHNPVEPGKPYLILDAANSSRGISLDEIGNQTCPISVVLAIEPKQVVFHAIQDPEAEYIKTEEPLDIKFSWVPKCAEPPEWRVEPEAFPVYLVLVGPRDNYTLVGTFRIKKTQNQSDEYNLAFKFDDIYEHVISTREYNDAELLVWKVFSKEGLNVKFYPAETLVDPASLPHIRKRII